MSFLSTVLKRFTASVVLVLLLLPGIVSAAGPTAMVYEGFLRNSSGVAQNGTAPVTVRIYDAQTGGTLLYEELHPAIVISEGYFSVPVGAVGDTNLGTDVSAFSQLTFSTNYFITTEIGAPFNTGEMTLSGGLRAPITLAPYAYNARSISSFASAPGGALNIGEVYYDSVTGSVYVYNGSGWIALNGADSVQGSDIVDGSLRSADLASDSVDGSKIVDASVLGADIIDDAITSTKIFDGTVSLADLAADSVDTSKIVDGTISLPDLAGNSVDSTKIVDGSVALADLAQSTIGITYGTTGSDISVSASPVSLGGVLSLNIPTASGSARGALSAADWTSFNAKEPALLAGTTLQFYRGDKTWTTLDTSVVPENGNLYFTSGRFDTAFGAKTTDNLLEGLTNKFYAPSLFNSDFAGKSTSSLAEGSNLYFTDARARSAVSAGSGLSYNSLTGVVGLDTAATNTWTGANTFANTGGVALLPFSTGVGNTTALRFSELAATGSNFVGFKAPDSIAADTIWSLPATDGAVGQVLSTNGSGVLAWASAGGASGVAGSLQFSSGSGSHNSNASNLFWNNTYNRLGIGTSLPTEKLDISGGNIRQFWFSGNPTYYIGDSSAVNQYGYINWDSANDLLRLGTQGGGSTLRISNNNRIGVNINPTTTERMTLLASSGDLNVLRLQRNENSGTGLGFNTFRRGDGTELGYITCNLTGLTCGLFNASDIRVKENIVDTSSGLETLMDLQVRDYHVKGDVEGNVQQGFIAQDLYNVYPQAVTRGDDAETLTPEGKMWGVDYGRITPLLVRAIQEQQLLLNDSTHALITSALAVSDIQNESPRNVGEFFAGRVSVGAKTISDFVSGRVTAIRGYFDTVIANQIITDQSTSAELCVGSTTERTCINRSQLNQLLQMLPAQQAVTENEPVPPTGDSGNTGEPGDVPTPESNTSDGDTPSENNTNGDTPPELVTPSVENTDVPVPDPS